MERARRRLRIGEVRTVGMRAEKVEWEVGSSQRWKGSDEEKEESGLEGS